MTESLEEFAGEENARRIIQKLLRQVAEAKADKDGLVEAVYRAAREAAEGLHMPPVAPPAHDTRKKAAEVAVAVLSDWQLAKQTKTYNTPVCEERIKRYGDKLISLVDIQRADHPVKELRIYLLGDIIEGEMIFPGQAHLIDASLFRQVMVDGPRILGDFVRRMLGCFERVHVVGVIGNHGALGGRARREYHPESNADAMLYEVVRMVLASERRLSWADNFTRGERHWYAVDQVGEKSFLLFHGDQVKGGFAGFPWYGFAKKIQGWRMGAIREPFEYALSGHFHTPVTMTIGPITLWGNGSTESDNTYAAEQLAAMGRPSQRLLFVHPKRGVTAEYNVWLDQ